MALTTPPVRCSFPTLFTPKSVNGGTPQFGIRLMFAKDNPEHIEFLKALAAEMNRILVEAWPNEATRPRIPVKGHNKSPIKDGDTAENQQGIPYCEKNPELKGHYFLSASCSEDRRPVVVDKNNQELLDKSKVYGGCWVRVNINPYARKRQDNPGISVGLNGVQFYQDDQSFGGGRASVSEMFGQPSAGETSDDVAF